MSHKIVKMTLGESKITHTTIRSLKSICIFNLTRNLEYYIDNLWLLPANVKNRILRRIIYLPIKDHSKLVNIINNLVNLDTRDMDFGELDVDDTLLKTVSNCKNLSQLILSRSGTHSITSNGFIETLPNLKQLTVFAAPNNKAINFNVIAVLVDSCKNLGSVDVSKCENLTDECMSELGKLKNLIGLKVSGTNITNKGLIALTIGESKSNIKELHLDCCSKIDQVALISVFDNCPKLETLMFNNNTNINGNVCFTSFEPPDNKKLKHVTWSVYW